VAAEEYDPPMADLGFRPFDADNHYYEAVDAFTRYIDPAMAKRCMQWADVGGKKRLLVGGKINKFIPNPTFDPIAKPGSLEDYFRGRNEEGLDLKTMFGELESIDEHPGYRHRDARLELLDEQGSNQESLYWRYETAIRALESRLASVTAGNGAIYAVRSDAYVQLEPESSHDLALPFTMVKRGRRAVFAPDARATEKALPTIEGEFARKRRIMRRGWPIVLRGGMLSPRGYGPLYALMVGSHRLLRLATPFLHLAALGSNIALVAQRPAGLYVITLALQAGLLAAAALAPLLPLRPLLVARYYVLTTASAAAGLWDWLRQGSLAAWERPPEAR
jgi:hypothetical protein